MEVYGGFDNESVSGGSEASDLSHPRDRSTSTDDPFAPVDKTPSVEILQELRSEREFEAYKLYDIPKPVERKLKARKPEEIAAVVPEQTLNIRPEISDKFRPALVEHIIEKSIKEELNGKTYNKDEVEKWTQNITQRIHERVKQLKFPRYKVVTVVVIGERRGQGMECAKRCLWDKEVDTSASYKYLSDSMACVGNVFGVYHY